MSEQAFTTDALRRAAQLDDSVRRRTRWQLRYLVAFGLGAGLYVATKPWHGDASELVLYAWLAFNLAVGVYACRQPVWSHGFERRLYAFVAVYVVLFAAALLVGRVWFEGEWAWYVPAGLVVAAPALVTGLAGKAAVTKVAGAARHPRHTLDPLIHSPVRFSIVAMLAGADQAEFSYVRDTVEVSDSVLSRQVSQLAQAGYVNVRKGYVGKWPRTWLSLTPAGRRAFERHLAALRAIAQ